MEHHTNPRAVDLPLITVRDALAEAGLVDPPRYYPSWLCAEAYLLALLRRVPALAGERVRQHATQVGISWDAIRLASERLNVVQEASAWRLPKQLQHARGAQVVRAHWHLALARSH